MKKLAVVTCMLFSTVAWGHEAIPTAAKPNGWTYPFACCSGYDCREVSRGQVTESPDGFIVPSKEILAYTDKRIKDSPDGEYHWCTVQGANDGKTICLFVPPRGF